VAVLSNPVVKNQEKKKSFRNPFHQLPDRFRSNLVKKQPAPSVVPLTRQQKRESVTWVPRGKEREEKEKKKEKKKKFSHSP